jgi:methylmalonyl-CoA mutase N-terminal domain/subunit
VNEFTVEGEELEIPLLKITEAAEMRQRERMAAMRARRDQGQVDATLERLKQAARTDENVIPPMLDAVRAYATLYEIRAAMEEVFGAYQEPVFF